MSVIVFVEGDFDRTEVTSVDAEPPPPQPPSRIQPNKRNRQRFGMESARIP
jgi:hypothetical protein